MAVRKFVPWSPEWRAPRNLISLRYVLAICCASCPQDPTGMVLCGLPPGHDGPHKDPNWAVTW